MTCRAFLKHMQPESGAHEVLAELTASTPAALLSYHTTECSRRVASKQDADAVVTTLREVPGAVREWAQS